MLRCRSKHLKELLLLLRRSPENNLHLVNPTTQPFTKGVQVRELISCSGIQRSDRIASRHRFSYLLPLLIRTSSSSSHNDGKVPFTDEKVSGTSAINDEPHASQGKSADLPSSTSSKETNTSSKPEVKLQSVTVELPKKKKKIRSKIDWSAVYTDNSYITPVRAMTDFFLTSSELEKLPKYSRRSPYPELGRITVYLKSDIEKKAHEVFGGQEKFIKHKTKMLSEKESHDKMTTLFRKAMKQYKRAVKKHGEVGTSSLYEENVKSVFKSGSGRVVVYAVTINAANFLLKVVAWFYTGSHSMFSEAIHSAADTVNQMILAFGIHQSIKKADSEHPYGYSNMRYVSSLISGVGIFCLGAGLSWYHGIHGLLHPQPIESALWAVGLLGGSLFSEGATLVMAVNQAKINAKRDGVSLLEYVKRGYEPSTNVVLLEDLAAVVGVGVAATCLTITMYTGNLLADCIGSMVIGCLLAGVASFIILTNTTALVGRSIPREKTTQICAVLESDRLVRALHDVKATDMGGKYIRFKAEVDFDGKELTRSYMDKLELEGLLAEMQKIKTIQEVEDSMLKHGEMIIDVLGSEVDRLEKKIMTKFPEVRHVDLEVL